MKILRMSVGGVPLRKKDYSLNKKTGVISIQGDFFNTINLNGAELTKAKEQTGLQDQRVLELFKRVGDGSMTPIRVHELYQFYFKETPLTSIRRSMTMLTNKGLLEKTNFMKMEKYGKSNYCWKLSTV